MTDTKIAARVRGFDAASLPENREDGQIVICSVGDLSISQSIPALSEIVRLGDSWAALSVSFAPIVVTPTTTSGMRLWNGEPQGGKVYVIDSVVATRLVAETITASENFNVWAQLQRGPVATTTHNASTTTVSLSGKPTYGGRRRLDMGDTAQTLLRWENIGTSGRISPVIAGTIFTSIDIPLFGRFIVSPGQSFAVQVTEITSVASSMHLTFRWHEMMLPALS